MTVQQRVWQTRDFALARQEAREIQRSHPTIFREMPISVSDLAYALGFLLEKRTELQQRARLEILREGGSEKATIALKEGLDRNVGRFAVAHEIGHAVLLRKYPDTSRDWDVGRKEVFASTFAAEILASPEARLQMAESFRSLSDPLTLLKLASQMGLSPRALLTIAGQEESWIGGLGKIWLRIKYLENAFTHTDPKLRIVSAHYDRSRFYVATNQSVARFAGTDQWLASLPVGTTARHSGYISLKSKRPLLVTPRFVARQIHAELAAARLYSNAVDSACYFIAVANMSHTAES